MTFKRVRKTFFRDWGLFTANWRFWSNIYSVVIYSEKLVADTVVTIQSSNCHCAGRSHIMTEESQKGLLHAKETPSCQLKPNKCIHQKLEQVNR